MYSIRNLKNRFYFRKRTGRIFKSLPLILFSILVISVSGLRNIQSAIPESRIDVSEMQEGCTAACDVFYSCMVDINEESRQHETMIRSGCYSGCTKHAQSFLPCFENDSCDDIWNCVQGYAL